jgi:tetratricopeptide (TPR) repeat protein
MRNSLCLKEVILIGILLVPIQVIAAEFVGSSRCASCHSEAAANWKISDHYKSMSIASSEFVLGNFNDISVNFQDISSRFYQRGSDYFIETVGDDGEQHEYLLSYTFGYYPLQQYLVEIDDGHIQALNLAWDSRNKEDGGQRWIHLQPGEPNDPASPFFWTRHLQNWNSRCAECHSTGLEKNYDVVNHSYKTSWSEINVACESCHGAGAEHVLRAESGSLSTGSAILSAPNTLRWEFLPGDSIAQPQGDKSNRYVDMCGGCHSRRAVIGEISSSKAYHDQYSLSLLAEELYYPDGQIQGEVFVLGSFLQSKMHDRGVTCMNCHEPHFGKLVLQGNALCGQCHLPKTFDTPRHHFHPSGSPGALCVECHMPETNYMLVDDRRDHRFGIPRPDISEQIGTPNACNGCHKGTTPGWASSTLALWLGSPVVSDPDALIMSLAQQGDPATTRAIIELAGIDGTSNIKRATLLELLSAFPSRVSIEAAAGYLEHEDPLVRVAAVRMLRTVSPEVRWRLLSPLIRDHSSSVRIEVAVALSTMPTDVPLGSIGEFTNLIRQYRESLTHSFDMPSTQMSLGNLERNLGNPAAAEDAYQRAIRIEPDYIPARLNLADLYRETGREALVIPLLQYALKAAPDSGAVSFSYGLSLIRQKMYQQSLSYLKAATEKDDSQPRYSYVYAVALDSVSNTREAIYVLIEANNKWPNQFNLMMTQILYMEKLGETDGILRILSSLSKLAPASPEVKRLLNKYVHQRP